MNNKYVVKEIEFPPFKIEFRRDGIYRINIYTKVSVRIFEGKFQITGYAKGIYKITRNDDEVYMGTFKELMKQLRQYRGQRLDSFKKIFNNYKRELEELK